MTHNSSHNLFNVEWIRPKTTYDSYAKQNAEMVKKGYPDFTENDWVLWIIPEFFHDTPDYAGKIQIIKRDGSEIDVSTCIRHPYPNKGYLHLSMKCGRKRLVGIPLVFSSFEELSEISDIIINWTSYRIYEVHPNPGDERDQTALPCVTNTGIHYHVNFQKDPVNEKRRWFTVYSSDHDLGIYTTWTDEFREEQKEYLSQYDLAVYGGDMGSIAFDNDTDSMSIANLMDNSFTHDIHKDIELDIGLHRAIINNDLSVLEEEHKVIKELVEYIDEICPDFRNKTRCFLWNGYYLQSDETLIAADTGDFIF